MRHIFKLILFAVVMLALGGIANGQSIVTGTGYTTQLIYQRGGYGADSVFGIPVRDTFCNNFLSPVPFRCKGRITIQPSTGNMYYHNGSYWVATSSGGGSGADSNVFVTHTQLDDSLDLYVRYVDTAGMLSPYVQKITAINTTSPLLGGGDLSTSRTISLAGLSGLGTANQILGMNNAGTAYEYKTLATGTTGTDFNIAHSANTATFNLPDASATNRGAVTTAAQTFEGAKTFGTVRPVIINGGTGEGNIRFIGSAGGSGLGSYFRANSGTLHAGFNAIVAGSTLTQWSVGGNDSVNFNNNAPLIITRQTVDANKLRLVANGNFGVSNTSPDEVLTVGNATENATNRKTLKFGVGGYAAPGNFSTASNGDKIIFYNGVDFDGRFGVSDMGDVWIKSISTNTANQSFGSFNVYTGQTSGAPTRRFMVSGTGNVSVADFTPLYLFTVGNGDLFGVNTAGKIPAYAGSAPTNGQLLIGHTANGTFEKATLTAGTGVAITNGAGSITIAADNNETITISAAGTLTLNRSNNYIFNGTTTTWTIPAVASSTGIVYKLKNRGSGNITINTTAAANELYTTLATNTYTLTPGSAIILVADGTFWNVE